MKRAAPLDALPLTIDPHAATPRWRQLSIGIRVLIANGRLRPGARLPSSRQLAAQMSVSRNTVIAAYEDLVARDLARGRIGAGSFVTDTARSGPPVAVWFLDASGNRLGMASLS